MPTCIIYLNSDFVFKSEGFRISVVESVRVISLLLVGVVGKDCLTNVVNTVV